MSGINIGAVPMNKENQEIERKFLIAYPSAQLLSTCRDVSKITQTYLSAPPGITARVRKREWPERCEYTHTEKRRMSDMRRLEFEQEISAAEYAEFLKSADPGRNPVHKKRCCLLHDGQLFEIDLYPFWQDRAIMEIELEDESQSVRFPPCISIIREVTGDKRYTNSAIAKHLPE